MTDMKFGNVAFDSSEAPYKGFSIKATYLEAPKGDAFIEIFRGGEAHRSFLYPAYKIWNLAAHFEDIVDGGYRAASWNGITPTGAPQPLAAPSDQDPEAA
jgi:hypothetical protein